MPVAVRGCMHHNRQLVKGSAAPLVWRDLNLDRLLVKRLAAVGHCLGEDISARVLNREWNHWIQYEC